VLEGALDLRLLRTLEVNRVLAHWDVLDVDVTTPALRAAAEMGS
jgi:hypothetical protein